MSKRAGQYSMNPNNYNLGGSLTLESPVASMEISETTFDEAPKGGSTGDESGNKRAAYNAAGVKNEMDAISGLMMASGNTPAMAAGAGLAVLSSAQKRKYANEEAVNKARLERLARTDAALARMVQVGEGMRRL